MDPAVTLLLGFQAGADPMLDPTAWGAVQGGALFPADLGPDPGTWRERLMEAQAQFPGRPWTLWPPADPGPALAELLGDGGRLVVPAGGPGARLAAQLPDGYTDVEGGAGDLTLRRPEGGAARRWRFQNGAWAPAPLPAERNAVAVTARETYDVGALLACMRAAQWADQHRVRTRSGRLAVDLHLQGEQGPGVDIGFRFRFFEAAGEPEEDVQEQVQVNGVRANLGAGLQLPIVESRTALAPPVALNLTERYRYRDGGPGGPGARRLRFQPADGDPLQFAGELLVQEATGRVLEERSERSGLPGTVKSEQRVLTYGDGGGGSWRVVRAASTERWMLSGQVTQVQRTLAYSDCRANDPGFEADAPGGPRLQRHHDAPDGGGDPLLQQAEGRHPQGGGPAPHLRAGPGGGGAGGPHPAPAGGPPGRAGLPGLRRPGPGHPGERPHRRGVQQPCRPPRPWGPASICPPTAPPCS